MVASLLLLRRFISFALSLSLPLLAGVVIALIWANADADSFQRLLHWSPFGAGHEVNFHFVFNDLFMVLFFGIAAGEITESCLPGGALYPLRRAVNPLLATAGGVLGPIGCFFVWVALTGDWDIARGWGIPTATDIALAWLIARVAFGADHPAVRFLLLLAVADDGIGLAIIAIFYPDPAHPVQPLWLALVAAGMLLALLLRRRGIHPWWVYLIGPGGLTWAGLYLAHLHPALALVFVVPFMPHAGVDEGFFADEEDDRPDTLNRFQHAFRTPVTIGLLGFGIANAGVELSSVGNPTWAVLVSLVAGKTAGVFLFAQLAVRLGFPLPDGMNARTLLVAGLTAAMGMTVALFVAGEAYPDPVTQGAAKMGALLSAGVAPLTLALAYLLRVKPRPATMGGT
jgi:Na+:H+ antiporter, NhaA family